MRRTRTLWPPCRLPHPVGDTGSLPMAMLLTLVGVSLSALLLPIVVNQMTASRTSIERGRALNAARAGIDIAMAHFRASVDGSGDGVPEQLPPCELTGALSPDTALRSPRYRVKITYRDEAGNDMGCPAPDIPAFATLQAVGTAAADGPFDTGTAGTRTLDATYTFRTSNTNIPGGLIRFTNGGLNLCLDAGPTLPPSPGTLVRVNTCQQGASRQRFAYNENLNLVLVGSASDTAPAGMCVTGNADTTGTDVTFTKCEQPTARTQVWSLDDASRFRGLKSTNPTSNPQRCLAVRPTPAAGSSLTITDCGNSNQTFQPADEVGAGRAGSDTGQLVNYEQFGRCLDVTQFTWDKDYMIAWFCKQEPAPGTVRWNQRWTIPAAGATGRILTTNDETAARPSYCLRSPATTDANRFVTLATCTATSALPPDLRWTVYGDTGNYATSYRIVDAYGNCLSPTDLTHPYSDSTHTDGTAKIKVEACTGSDLQKWNAPANLKQPTPLTDINEK